MSFWNVSFYLYLVYFFISVSAAALTFILSDIAIAKYVFFWLIFAQLAYLCSYLYFRTFGVILKNCFLVNNII